ncbi:hypothetical protein S40288_11017 [Stachybotrys chartarum IBT 40288]|nr:hypothetical protein S40288_11017 [Stachybotrys chartarum IBT 40288]
MASTVNTEIQQPSGFFLKMACCCIARFRLDPMPNKPAAASGIGMYVARASWLLSVRLQHAPSLPSVRVRSMADQERALTWQPHGPPIQEGRRLAAFQGFPAHLQVDDHLISSYLVFPPLWPGLPGSGLAAQCYIVLCAQSHCSARFRDKSGHPQARPPFSPRFCAVAQKQPAFHSAASFPYCSWVNTADRQSPNNADAPFATTPCWVDQNV